TPLQHHTISELFKPSLSAKFIDWYSLITSPFLIINTAFDKWLLAPNLPVIGLLALLDCRCFVIGLLLFSECVTQRKLSTWLLNGFPSICSIHGLFRGLSIYVSATNL